MLLGIENRGTDSTGVATIRGNGDIWIEKAELNATEFIKVRTGLDKKIKTILLHTRYATQGHQSNLLNNHPVDYNNCVIVHNGHIRNDSELFFDADLERNAEVDSEIIAALFDKHGIEKAHLALQELDGGFAVAAIDQRKPTALVLAKGKSSPLVYYKNDNFIVWASDSATILDTFNLIELNSGTEIFHKDLKYGKEGEIVFIEHGQMENLEFKVKTPVYSASKSKKWIAGYGYADNWEKWEKDYKKENKKTDEEIRKEVVPRYGSYSIYPEAGGEPIVYRCCWDCGVAANEDLLKAFDGSHYCDVCIENQYEWTKQDGEDRDKEKEEEDQILAEFEAKEHMIVCDKIGNELGIPGRMVDYLLFNCEELLDDEVDNQEIVDIYEELAELYDIEIGVVDGDVEEVEESQVKKMEIVKRRGVKNLLGW